MWIRDVGVVSLVAGVGAGVLWFIGVQVRFGPPPPPEPVVVAQPERRVIRPAPVADPVAAPHPVEVVVAAAPAVTPAMVAAQTDRMLQDFLQMSIELDPELDKNQAGMELIAQLGELGEAFETLEAHAAGLEGARPVVVRVEAQLHLLDVMRQVPVIGDIDPEASAAHADNAERDRLQNLEGLDRMLDAIEEAPETTASVARLRAAIAARR